MLSKGSVLTTKYCVAKSIILLLKKSINLSVNALACLKMNDPDFLRVKRHLESIYGFPFTDWEVIGYLCRFYLQHRK